MQKITELAAQKSFLRTIVENKYILPEDLDPYTFVKALLPNFASTDEELRDILSYPIMAQIIMGEQYQERFTGGQLEDLLLTSIDDDHLFYRISEAGTDSVFMRSFSSLMIPVLLIADAQKPRISEEAVRRVLATVLRYVREERDWRGYVSGKGWAHAAAHISDALDDCAKNRYMTAADCESILATLTYLAQLTEPLRYEEDDRLAFVAYGIITRQAVEMANIKTWIASLVLPRPTNSLIEEGVLEWNRAANAKNFLRGLYFQLSWSKVATLREQKVELLAAIDQALQQLNSLPATWFAGEGQG